jgi:hypothetical protein
LKSRREDRKRKTAQLTIWLFVEKFYILYLTTEKLGK